MKKDYWKTVCPEFPGGMISKTLEEARNFADGERNGYPGEVYIRKIRMTEEEFNELSDDV